MAQVIVVHATPSNALCCFLNGVEIIHAGTPMPHAHALVDTVAEQLCEAHGIEVERFVRSHDHKWTWTDIRDQLIGEGCMIPPASGHFMKGFYRCDHCYTQWDRIDDTNEALPCVNCGMTGIEPFCSAEQDTPNNDPLVINALADHERRYPSPLETGSYEVYVTRSATRQACIQVQDAVGPASAQLSAIDQAPDIAFQRESDAEYDVNGWVGQGLLSKGNTVWWEDPDDSACSCEAKVVDAAGDDICLGRDGSETFWVPASEVKPL